MSPETTAPLLNPAIIADDKLLGSVVDEFIRTDVDDRDHRETFALLQEHLRAHVADDVWAVFLKLDETVGARLADLSLAVARWAYLEGLRYGGGGNRSEGGGK